MISLRVFGEGYVGSLPLLRLMVIGGLLVVVVNFSITVLNIQKGGERGSGYKCTKGSFVLGTKLSVYINSGDYRSWCRVDWI